MTPIDDPLFQALFQADIPRLIVRADSSPFTVLDYNIAYAKHLPISDGDYRGQDLWSVFGMEEKDLYGFSLQLSAALEEAGVQRQPTAIKVREADIFLGGEGLDLGRAYLLHISPVYAGNTELAYFILSVSVLEDEPQTDEVMLNPELTSADEEVENGLTTKHEELSANEELFRLLIRQAPVGICVIRSSDLNIIEVNDGYLTLVGKRREHLQHKTVWEAIPEAASSYAPVMDEVIRSGIPFVAKEHELLLIRFGSPEVVWVDFVYEPVVSSAGTVSAVMVVAIDVTEKVVSRKAIEEAGQRTNLAIESADIGTFEYNYETDKVLTSTRFDEIFDVSNPDSRAQLLGSFHPEDVHLSAEAHAVAARDGKMMYEARLLHKDKSIHWIRVHAKVFYHHDGTPHKLLGTVLDITTHKFLQQQKDDFISIASHELKTPITSLKASLQFLMRIQDRMDFDLSTRLLEQANRSMERISKLIDDLLNVSTINNDLKLHKKNFLLVDLFKEIWRNNHELDRYALRIEAENDIEVYADEHQIEQVLVNFVNNALKYAAQSNEFVFTVERLGAYIRVSFRDQGPGIPAEKQQHIFNRYVRADESGIKVSGLGLGLYISADIVHRHQGEIGVYSMPGEGATFWFTLPSL